MKKLISEWTACVAAGLLLLASTAMAKEEEIPLDKLPKAVVDAVKAKFPGAELVKAEKETEDDKTVFEVALKHKKQKYEVSLTPDGKITEIEREIAVKDLPKAVTEALAKKYPHSKLEEAEEVTVGDKITSYEVELITSDKKELEVTVDPKGKILKEEAEEDEDEDDEDEDDEKEEKNEDKK